MCSFLSCEQRERRKKTREKNISNWRQEKQQWDKVNERQKAKSNKRNSKSKAINKTLENREKANQKQNHLARKRQISHLKISVHRELLKLTVCGNELTTKNRRPHLFSFSEWRASEKKGNNNISERLTERTWSERKHKKKNGFATIYNRILGCSDRSLCKHCRC